jgi:hypothetical protein
MREDEIFISATRSKNDLAGVLECDNETCYFYLYQLTGFTGNKILNATNLARVFRKADEPELEVRWDKNELSVGVFYKGTLVAHYNENAS